MALLGFGAAAAWLLTPNTMDAGRSRAPEPKATSQTWVACKDATDSRVDGDNQLITATVRAKFTGTLNGSCEGTERETIRKDGSQSFSGSGTFVGEINGRSGTAIMTYTGTLDSKGALSVSWVMDKGTDDLARIDGQGTLEGGKRGRAALPTLPPAECEEVEGQSIWGGAYSGSVHFG